MKISNQSRGTSGMTIKADYSIYTLSQLFKARYWIDTGGESLEEEIQKRCTHIRERNNGKPFVAAGSSSRFKPYGLRVGVVFLTFCIGPFAAVKFLDAVRVIKDVNGDNGELSGLWALLTLPVMFIIFMIGAMTDVDRVAKWFNLNGRQKNF